MKKPIDPNLNSDNAFDILDRLDVQAEVNDNSSPSAKVTANSNEPAEDKPEAVDNSSFSHNNEHSHSHHGEHHHSSEHHSSHHSSSHHHSSGHHHHSSHHHSGSHHHHHKKKTPLAIKLAIAFLILILLAVFVIVGAFFFLQHSGKSDLQNVNTQTNYEEVIEHDGHKYVYNKDVVAIAFLGIDKRDINESSTIGTNGQSDTTLVLTVNTANGRAKVIAIPRDSMVDVDLFDTSGTFLRSEKMQLCLSYAYGDGKEKSATNVTTSMSRILYNVPINKYFALDLDGIAPINDAIGGVTVTSLYNFDNLGIRVGDEVRLTGDMTETYVRYRNIDSLDSSLNRTERQIQYINAFASQAVPAVMNDFSVISRLYETASGYSSTNMSLSNVTYLASLLISKGINNFETETLKGEMKLSDKEDRNGFTYAEFYVDEDAVLETVLDTFYTQVG